MAKMDVIINRSYRSYRNDQKPKYVMRADGKSILCPLLLLAGPAISFVGSPTLSPTTIVACVGFLLPSDSPAHQTQQQSSHGATPEQDPSKDLPQPSLRSDIGAGASQVRCCCISPPHDGQIMQKPAGNLYRFIVQL